MEAYHCFRAHGDKSDPPLVEDPEYSMTAMQDQPETAADSTSERDSGTSTPDGTTDGTTTPPEETAAAGDAMQNGAIGAPVEEMERLEIKDGEDVAVEEDEDGDEEAEGAQMNGRSRQGQSKLGICQYGAVFTWLTSCSWLGSARWYGVSIGRSKSDLRCLSVKKYLMWFFFWICWWFSGSKCLFFF